jgi:hypothetical protein
VEVYGGIDALITQAVEVGRCNGIEGSRDALATEHAWQIPAYDAASGLITVCDCAISSEW